MIQNALAIRLTKKQIESSKTAILEETKRGILRTSGQGYGVNDFILTEIDEEAFVYTFYFVSKDYYNDIKKRLNLKEIEMFH